MLLRRLLVIAAVAGITSIAVAQKIPVVKAWSPGERFVVLEGFYRPT